MLKKFRLPALALGAALTLLSPMAALARHHEPDRDDYQVRIERHHRPHFRVFFGPSVRYGPNYGYYDEFGFWHPYPMGGYYDAWGFWHPYRY